MCTTVAPSMTWNFQQFVKILKKVDLIKMTVDLMDWIKCEWWTWKHYENIKSGKKFNIIIIWWSLLVMLIRNLNSSITRLCIRVKWRIGIEIEIQHITEKKDWNTKMKLIKVIPNQWKTKIIDAVFSSLNGNIDNLVHAQKWLKVPLKFNGNKKKVNPKTETTKPIQTTLNEQCRTKNAKKKEI